MKTPEQHVQPIAKFSTSNQNFWHIGYKDALKLVEQVQKEAWNSALDWAAEHSRFAIKNRSTNKTSYYPYGVVVRNEVFEVDKESILKGKI